MNEFNDIDRDSEEWNWNNAEPVENILYWQIERIEQLLTTSNFDHDERDRIEKKSEGLTRIEADYVIVMLEENQLDPIQSGRNYCQKEIKNKIQREL